MVNASMNSQMQVVMLHVTAWMMFILLVVFMVSKNFCQLYCT